MQQKLRTNGELGGVARLLDVDDGNGAVDVGTRYVSMSLPGAAEATEACEQGWVDALVMKCGLRQQYRFLWFMGRKKTEGRKQWRHFRAQLVATPLMRSQSDACCPTGVLLPLWNNCTQRQ